MLEGLKVVFTESRVHPVHFLVTQGRGGMTQPDPRDGPVARTGRQGSQNLPKDNCVGLPERPSKHFPPKAKENP